MTFPPEKFNGTLLSGMCVPDLKGTQGTFVYYSSNSHASKEWTGGAFIPVNIESGRIRTYLPGPENQLLKAGGEMRLPLKIHCIDEQQVALSVDRETFILKTGEYSDWKKLAFRPGLNKKIHGICRFYIKQIAPAFEMYVTPSNIDPEKPALPISHPSYYSVYLSKMIGDYATLGLAEDTWALNTGAISEDAFIDQAYQYHLEREEMFFSALEKTRQGLCACVFDITDRMQHMFFKDKKIIENVYRRMDEMMGRLLKKIDDKTLLVVMSDHGFAPFNRGVNLNTWLRLNGYLSFTPESKETDIYNSKWLTQVDWEKTRAYALGLSGIYINRQGRESKGIVKDGDDLVQLKQELSAKLTGLVDEEKGEIAVRQVADTERLFSGPYRSEGPDLLICYNRGYRNSWACAEGRITETVFDDNKKHWSGDHCIDPQLVPGIFISNRKINTDTPHIKDIAPTIIDIFGIPVPSHIQGRPLLKK
jgi:hypothetical protein